MFYVNNKQVLGMFLNGKNYNYLSYGFSKIIPENRSAQYAYINLAGRNLSQYRVEYGNVQSGYDNFPIARLDYPVNGIFHSPLTYYYGGNIVPTKNVPVVINNGYCAIRGAVYNDIDINGNIVNFATDSNFQGHNVNVFPENIRSNQPYLNGTVMNNCSNCNITTKSVVPGFDRMTNCNFNVYLPSNANVKNPAFYSILSNSSNCKYTVNGLGSNLVNFINVGSGKFMFENLNRCNLNLLLSNSTGLDVSIGNRLNNCDIKFDNINLAPSGYSYFNHLSNCNITGNVVKSDSTYVGLVCDSTNANINVNASSTNDLCLILRSSYINGNAILGKNTKINHSNSLILYLYNGNFAPANVSNSKFSLYNVRKVNINVAYNCNFNLYNTVGSSILKNLNKVNFVERGGANFTIANIDNCYNSYIYANTMTGTIENVYNTRINLKNNNAYFETRRVNNCEITGFPHKTAYTTNCTFNVSIPQALFRNNSYVTWANVWPHTTLRGSDGPNPLYSTNAGLESVSNFSGCRLNCNNGSLLYGSIIFNNANNVITDIKTFYKDVVKVNLQNYAGNIKLNVDCHHLSLGVFMAGPPHGLEYSSISADNIYCTTGKNYYVYVNYGTRIYCENFCNVPFSPAWYRFSENYQPVLLINNYQCTNYQACNFNGGIVRIGSLNYMGSTYANMHLANGTCMFINNVKLINTTVNNALLFLGTNAHISGPITVTNGGLVVNKANYSMDAIGKFVNRNNFTWNFQDSGPWGWRSLLNFCIDV